MTDKFDPEIFAEWQSLVTAWDKAERELKELQAARERDADGTDAKLDEDPREAELVAGLAQLKADIDTLVLRISGKRDTSSEEMVVALIDTKPDNKTFAEMVREKLARHVQGR